MKTCRKCNESKPVSEFYRHPMMSDGHLNFCKCCVKLRVRIHRRKNEERVTAYDRSRASRSRVAQPKHGHSRVYSILDRAVESGGLARRPCSFCGEVKVEAHHFDYQRPLDVVWLCPKHHRRAHAIKRCGAIEPSDADLLALAFPNQ